MPFYVMLAHSNEGYASLTLFDILRCRKIREIHPPQFILLDRSTDFLFNLHIMKVQGMRHCYHMVSQLEQSSR